jgi:hypothetical protein
LGQASVVQKHERLDGRGRGQLVDDSGYEVSRAHR